MTISGTTISTKDCDIESPQTTALANGSLKRKPAARRPVQKAYLRGLRLFETREIATIAHTLTHHEAVAPTCTATGSIEYWQCSACDKKFSDETCTTEVTDVTIPMANHTLNKTDAKAATCTEAGNTEYWTCSVCKKAVLGCRGQE